MVKDNSVVGIHFTLKNQNNEVIETTEGDAPFEYLQGAMEILPALESAMVGKKVGDKDSITIPADEAYGKYNDELVEVVPMSEFEDFEGTVEVGLEIEMQVDDDYFPVVVTKVEGDKVTLDMNHPLAGMDLTFDVEVLSIREATEEELEHGHAHSGACGHDHKV